MITGKWITDLADNVVIGVATVADRVVNFLVPYTARPVWLEDDEDQTH